MEIFLGVGMFISIVMILVFVILFEVKISKYDVTIAL